MENTIECRDCAKKLMHWFYTKRGQDKFRIMAKCPFCHGASFWVDIDGKFAYGPIGKDESVNPTKIVSMDKSTDGGWIFTLERNK